MSPPTPTILGIDPGTRVSGYGILEVSTRGPRYRASGTIRSPHAGATPGDRLRALRDGLLQVFRKHRPDVVALETPFVGRNVRSALRIGEARGVILLTASEAGVPVHEYAPAEVKRSVVGHGGASKPQVASLVQVWLGLPSPPRPADAADALGLALCHAQRSRVAPLLRPPPASLRRRSPAACPA
ncbi:MAG: crossover junction endodeoxyribonuclease RuvC [Planctomycetota bacterium]